MSIPHKVTMAHPAAAAPGGATRAPHGGAEGGPSRPVRRQQTPRGAPVVKTCDSTRGGIVGSLRAPTAAAFAPPPHSRALWPRPSLNDATARKGWTRP